jgi:hypothetical protein
MNEYFGDDNGWQTDGIVYLNGVTDADGGHNIRYRTYSNKSGIGFVLYGELKVPISVIKNSAGGLIEGSLLTLPVASTSNIIDGSGLPYMAPSDGGQVRLRLATSSGILSVVSINGSTAEWAESAKLTDTMWININHTFMILE